MDNHDDIPPPASLAELGSLLGDPVRAAILLALSDGTRRPAGELARLCGASPQAASAHLALLVAGGLLCTEKCGRHRFYALASGEAAEIIEMLSNWALPRVRPLRHDPALCRARLCYDHVAGQLGVALFDRLAARGFLEFSPHGPGISPAGRRWMDAQGVDITARPGGRRPLIRLCLDWTERRHHLGGQLGAALATMLIAKGHLARSTAPRLLSLTPRGAHFLCEELGVRLSL